MTILVFAFAATLALAVAHQNIPQPDDESSLNFVMVGDWGGQDDRPYYTDAEMEIAAQMGTVAERVGAQFTVALGDNFYSHGVKDVDDARFKETFEV